MTRDLLLLIVLTEKAKDKIDRDQLANEFEGKCVRLYNIRDINEKESGNIQPVALPLIGGKVCVLTKDPDRDYFVCIDVYRRGPVPPDAHDYFHELPRSEKLKVPEDTSKMRGYLDYATDCGKIMEHVKSKKEWKIHEAQSGTGWDEYFEVRKRIISERKFEAWATISRIDKRYAKAVFKLEGEHEKSEEFAKIIEGARGEDVNFSFSLGCEKQK